jgi:hypothetical protein
LQVKNFKLVTNITILLHVHVLTLVSVFVIYNETGNIAITLRRLRITTAAVQK